MVPRKRCTTSWKWFDQDFGSVTIFLIFSLERFSSHTWVCVFSLHIFKKDCLEYYLRFLLKFFLKATFRQIWVPLQEAKICPEKKFPRNNEATLEAPNFFFPFLKIPKFLVSFCFFARAKKWFSHTKLFSKQSERLQKNNTHLSLTGLFLRFNCTLKKRQHVFELLSVKRKMVVNQQTKNLLTEINVHFLLPKYI